LNIFKLQPKEKKIVKINEDLLVPQSTFTWWDFTNGCWMPTVALIAVW
jgi:hypothetical protein